MKHLSEDKLLEFALEMLTEETEINEITEHLERCPECREILSGIQESMDIISGISPKSREIQMPPINIPQPYRYTWLKAAALIVFGFIAGFGSSYFMTPETVRVSPSYIQPSPPADSLLGYASSDATAVPPEYYESLSKE